MAPAPLPFLPALRRLALACAWAVACAALVGLIGWALGAPGLLGVPSGSDPIRPYSAMILLLAGSAAGLRLIGHQGLDRASRVLGWLVILVAGAALLHALWGRPAPLDLAARGGITGAGGGTTAPVPSMALLAAGIVLARRRWRRAWVREALAAGVLLVGLTVCVAYVVGVRFVHDPILDPLEMALATGWMTALLGVALLLLQPTAGWMRTVASDSAGGYMARRLLPTALLLPVAVGLLARAGQQAERYGDDLKLAIVLMVSIVALAAVTILGTGTLHRLDDARRQVQRRLAQREAHLAEALRGEREARAHAQEADRRKDEFLAILGHELRNPLSPILTALRLLRLKGVHREVEWEVIDRQARHLSRLVDDLLDVSRVTSGRIALQRAPVELSRVVEHALEMTAPLIEERRHALRVTVPERGLVIDADEGRMAQVVGNLLTNAAKYTDPGGTIRVHAEPRGDEVVLCVADDGQGIDPEVLPHMFDLFVQSPRSLDRSSGGLGIGLAIVRSLVELHGGTVSVHSDGLHTGSEMTVRLPRHARSLVPNRTESVPAPIPAGETHRVLVVDDNRDAADVLGLALRVRGHAVEVAYDGPSALERLQSFEPEVALLDLGLPAMDGYALARHIHQHPNGRNTHLIAVTGYSRPSDRRRSLEAGFDLHLVKPIEPDSLEDHIRTVVATPMAPPGETPAVATGSPGPSPVGGPGGPPGRGSPRGAR